MKFHIITFLLISISVAAQKPIETSFIKDTPLQAETWVASDNFTALYYITKNVLHKKDNTRTISYSNLQLGEMTSVNAYNPLKINIFYKDFNTAIILDNRLAEMFRLDFSRIEPYRSVSHISSGHDNTLWLYNQNTQQLEVYDYASNTTRAKTLPISNPVLDIKSNYNYCWLLTTHYLYVFNYVGTLLSKTKNHGFTSMGLSDENIVLKKDNSLFYLKKNTLAPVPISLPILLINQFSVTNQTLYIYSNEILKQFQLKTN